MSEAENFDTEILGATNDEQLDALGSFDIATLRKVAKIFGIAASRTWGKDDYIDAIKRKQDQNSHTNFVFDSEKAPKPGYARIVIHRDPTPGHNNAPVHLGFNGSLVAVPRGIEVDVPYPFVEILSKAVTVTTEMVEESTSHNPGGRFKDEHRPSYPFQVLAITPGEYVNSNDNRVQGYAQRKAFHDKFGHWPTYGELNEWKKAKLNYDVQNNK